MSNLADIWAGQTDPLPQQGNTELRGNDTIRTIMQRPSEIIISRRDPTTQKTIYLAPQIVRIDIIQSIRGATEQLDKWTDIARQYTVLMGFKDCPGRPDTDLLRTDQFFYAGLMWQVLEFIPTVPGRLLASLEATP